MFQDLKGSKLKHWVENEKEHFRHLGFINLLEKIENYNLKIMEEFINYLKGSNNRRSMRITLGIPRISREAKLINIHLQYDKKLDKLNISWKNFVAKTDHLFIVGYK